METRLSAGGPENREQWRRHAHARTATSTAWRVEAISVVQAVWRAPTSRRSCPVTRLHGRPPVLSWSCTCSTAEPAETALHGMGGAPAAGTAAHQPSVRPPARPAVAVAPHIPRSLPAAAPPGPRASCRCWWACRRAGRVQARSLPGRWESAASGARQWWLGAWPEGSQASTSMCNAPPAPPGAPQVGYNATFNAAGHREEGGGVAQVCDCLCGISIREQRVAHRRRRACRGARRRRSRQVGRQQALNSAGAHRQRCKPCAGPISHLIAPWHAPWGAGGPSGAAELSAYLRERLGRWRLG